eukprot:2175862-Amphidinium_carterae.1
MLHAHFKIAGLFVWFPVASGKEARLSGIVALYCTLVSMFDVAALLEVSAVSETVAQDAKSAWMLIRHRFYM